MPNGILKSFSNNNFMSGKCFIEYLEYPKKFKIKSIDEKQSCLMHSWMISVRTFLESNILLNYSYKWTFSLIRKGKNDK